MAEKTIQELLKSTFQKNTKEDWIKFASTELKGDNPITSLAWNTSDNISISPIYHKSDGSELQYLSAFSLQADGNVVAGARAWLNLPKVIVVDELKANTLALDHLSNGADGILFYAEKNILHVDKLLNEIEWPYCTLSFMVSSSTFTDGVRAYINTKKYDPALLSGSFYWKDLPSNCVDLINQFKAEKKIQCLGLIIQPSSPVQEIVNALTKAVNMVDVVTEQGICAEDVINNISFSLPIGSDFFTELAKLKVLRMLWYQITQAYGVTDFLPADLNLHVRCEVWHDENFKPHGNMLKSTTASMAAVFGGCNALTVYAEDANDTMMNRMARNVSTIMREESHLDIVADPTAGSYALDHIMHQMATKAWATFISNTNFN